MLPRSLPLPQSSVSVEYIERHIYLIQGRRVMLDSDLAVLYGVSTKRLNEAVRRNRSRFPGDFMFQLGAEEAANLKSQIATSSFAHGGRRTLPYAFTEHGVAMLSSVLRSERAVQMNILIIRAFIALRDMLATHKDLARKMATLERRQAQHGEQLAAVYAVVRRLINPPAKSQKRIGFTASMLKHRARG